MNSARLTDFLTDHEIKQAIKLAKTSNPTQLVRDLEEQIIQPNIQRINTALGQENSPRFLAYAVSYALSREAQ